MSENTSTALWAVQCAVVSKIQGVSGIGSVYDEVQSGATLPYTVIGTLFESRFEARGVKGHIVTVPLVVHSRATGGRAEATAILAKIVETMTASALSITGWKEMTKAYMAGDSSKQVVEKNTSFEASGSFQIWVCKST